MRYLLLATLVGATVVGAGWVALDKPQGNEWRQDLLDLVPFDKTEADDATGYEVPDSDDPSRPGKKKKRKRRGKRGHAPPAHTPSAAPSTGTSAAATPAPPRIAPPPPSPPPAPGSPSPAEAHYQAGLTYLQQKRIPAAISELKKCIALNPRHALAYRALGMANSVLGKQSSAVEAFEKFVKLAPGHKDVPKVRAIIEAHRSGGK